MCTVSDQNKPWAHHLWVVELRALANGTNHGIPLGVSMIWKEPK